MRRRGRSAGGAFVVVGGIAAVLSIGGVADASTGFSLSPRHAAPTSTTQTVITSVQVSGHSDFDRVTVTFSGPQPGYDIAYRSRITSEPMGRLVNLRGSAFLQLMLHPTSTVQPAPQRAITPGLQRIEQVKGAGDFEALTAYGIGVAKKGPFRVQRLSSPNRLVIDVADPEPTLPKTGPANLPLTFTGFTLLFTGLALCAGGRPGTGKRGGPPRPAMPRFALPTGILPPGMFQPTGRRRREAGGRNVDGRPLERYRAQPASPPKPRRAPEARPSRGARPAGVDRIVYLSFVDTSSGQRRDLASRAAASSGDGAEPPR